MSSLYPEAEEGMAHQDLELQTDGEIFIRVQWGGN